MMDRVGACQQFGPFANPAELATASVGKTPNCNQTDKAIVSTFH